MVLPEVWPVAPGLIEHGKRLRPSRSTRSLVALVVQGAGFRPSGCNVVSRGEGEGLAGQGMGEISVGGVTEEARTLESNYL